MGNPISRPSQNGPVPAFPHLAPFHIGIPTRRSSRTTTTARHFRCKYWKHLAPPLIEGCGRHHVIIHPASRHLENRLATSSADDQQQAGHHQRAGDQVNLRRPLHMLPCSYKWCSGLVLAWKCRLWVAWASTPLVPFCGFTCPNICTRTRKWVCNY